MMNVDAPNLHSRSATTDGNGNGPDLRHGRGRVVLIVRGDKAEEEAVKQQYPGYTIKKAQEMPYLGTSAPMYGAKAWKMTAKPAELQKAFEKAIEGHPPAVAAKFREQLHKVTSAAPLDVPAKVKTKARQSWEKATRKLVALGEMTRHPKPRELDEGGSDQARARKKKRKKRSAEEDDS